MSYYAEYQSTKIPEYQSTKVPKYQSTRVPEYQSTKVPKYQSTRAPQYQSTRVPEYQSARVPECQNTRVPEYSAIFCKYISVHRVEQCNISTRSYKQNSARQSTTICKALKTVDRWSRNLATPSSRHAKCKISAN